MDQTLSGLSLSLSSTMRFVASHRVAIGRFAFGLGLLGLWQAASVQFGADLVAAPGPVFHRLIEIASNGILLRHTVTTLTEATTGFLIGGGLGVVLPLIVWRWTRGMQALEPYIVTAIGIPKLAFAPLLILWFGIALGSKVVLVALMVFFMMFIMTLAGIRSIDLRIVGALKVMGASNWFIMREVIWNSALPYILTSIRIGIPRAFSAAIVGEFLASDRGLGYYIAESRAIADPVGVYTGIAAVTLIVVGFDTALKLIESRMLRWRATDKTATL
jgi:NitT/TauT family transport system permease protein